jgi:hypothetical protein
MAKKLFLHVGHGKTGSSYIQSILSTHRQRIFDKLGINYPSVENDKSAEGKISSGNGGIFLRNPAQVQHVHQDSRENSILYSSEFLFSMRKRWLNANTIKELLSYYDNIEILIFIRNPDEILSSAYQQAVKRGGYTQSIDTYLEQFEFISEVKEFLENAVRFKNVKLTVYNYSNVRDKIALLLAQWLGSDETFDVPFPPINRSLTYAELVLQGEINKHFGRSGDLVADDLCECLPHIKADTIYPSSKAWADFREKMLPTLNAINAIVPESEKLAFDEQLSSNSSLQSALSIAQIQVVAASIFSKLARKS